jgi:hypothetical protein
MAGRRVQHGGAAGVLQLAAGVEAPEQGRGGGCEGACDRTDHGLGAVPGPLVECRYSRAAVFARRASGRAPGPVTSEGPVAARHVTRISLAVFEGADGGGGEAVGDVASHQLGGFGGAAVHDEGDKLVVFL